MKILVIEKSEVCRFILGQCLNSLGHALHCISSADDALPFFYSHEIDFVFIDMDFERERAVDTVKSLRKKYPENSWFPVVALSSEVDEESFANAILAGADALLPKPLNRNRILMQVIALERIYIARQSLEAKKDLIAANLALLKLSMYDPITGLANRRYFEETLTKEMKLAKREHRPLSLLLCETVPFVAPHKAGDGENGLMITLAAAIQSVASRPTDFICRYDDHSFALILPNTAKEGALRVAERIRRSVEPVLAKIALDAPEVPPTFRIGSAIYDEQFQKQEDFIHAASVMLMQSGPEMH